MTNPPAGPDLNTKSPGYKMPRDACDCHVHVIGPVDRFPFASEARAKAIEAPKESLEIMHRKIGADRCVIVHAGTHGNDLAVTLDAMATSYRQVRAVAKVEGSITDARLLELTAAGFRAVRYTPALDGKPVNRDAVSRIADRIAPLGWHILFLFRGNDLPEYAEFLSSLPVTCLLDHFGGIDPTGSTEQETYQVIVELLGKNCWIKLSAPERLSSEAYPFEDITKIGASIIKAAPDRVIWGTDWPHPSVPPPALTNDGDLVDLIPAYTKDPALQKKLLVDNPARLYEFY